MTEKKAIVQQLYMQINAAIRELSQEDAAEVLEEVSDHTGVQAEAIREELEAADEDDDEDEDDEDE